MVSFSGAGLRFMSALLLDSPEEVLGFLKGYLLERLLKVSPSALSGAIRDDTDIWGSLPRGYRTMVHNLARSKTTRAAFTKYSSMVTDETVLGWLLDPFDRPDAQLDARERQDKRHWQALASVIVNYPGGKGRAYLARQVASLKRAVAEAMDGKVSPPPPQQPARIALERPS